MGLIIVQADFIGKHKIAQNNFTEIEPFILQYEGTCLIDLLGVELYKLFKADIDPATHAPQNEPYKTLFNEILEDEEDGKTLKSGGIKQMLLGFLYFEYMRDQGIKQTPVGPVKAANEVATKVGFGEFDIWNRYNDAVKNHNEIQRYIGKNPDTFPKFNGKPKELIYWV